MENINHQCAIDLPYPEINAIGSSLTDLRCIKGAYAGNKGEFTALNQYMYQALILANSYPEIANMLECISLTEMKHFELLGEAIVSCGGDPKYCGSYSYWTGMNVDYSNTVQQILKVDIAAEKEAIIEYNKIILCVRNNNLKELINRIVMDEEAHLKMFEEALHNISE